MDPIEEFYKNTDFLVIYDRGIWFENYENLTKFEQNRFCFLYVANYLKFKE